MNGFGCMVAAVIILIVGFIGGGIAFTVAEYNNKQSFEITVTDKEAKGDSSSSKYLVFTKTDEETKVFQVTDALFAGKFNSSDIYGSLEVGKTYSVDTIGFRIPFLSTYENIMEFKEVE
ncbi:hypothetical protein ACI2JA_03320 [Alkalihalobacillus sp. NPDC078783]